MKPTSASIRFSYSHTALPRFCEYRAVLYGRDVEIYDVRGDGAEIFRDYARSMSGLSGAARIAVCCHAHGQHVDYPGLVAHAETAWVTRTPDSWRTIKRPHLSAGYYSDYYGMMLEDGSQT